MLAEIAPALDLAHSAALPGTLLGEVDLVGLLSASKGIVLGVVIILLTLVALTIFVIVYKLIHISLAQSQSISFRMM